MVIFLVLLNGARVIFSKGSFGIVGSKVLVAGPGGVENGDG